MGMSVIIYCQRVVKNIVRFQKISIPPSRNGSDFPGGRGGSICLIFQWGGGGHHREIFPEGSRDL